MDHNLFIALSRSFNIILFALREYILALSPTF